jgi:predicted AAA+ superfamily ATPase
MGRKEFYELFSLDFEEFLDFKGENVIQDFFFKQ